MSKVVDFLKSNIKGIIVCILILSFIIILLTKDSFKKEDDIYSCKWYN